LVPHQASELVPESAQLCYLAACLDSSGWENTTGRGTIDTVRVTG